MQNLKIQKYLYDMQKKKEDTTHTYVKYSGSSTETNSYLTFITLVMLKLWASICICSLIIITRGIFVYIVNAIC